MPCGMTVRVAGVVESAAPFEDIGGAAGDGEAGPGSPLARIVSMLDPGLANDRPLTYRRTQTLPDLVAAFERLKAVDFLNLRQFERRFADALGWLGDPAAVPILTGELFAADPGVRCQALDSLANIGDGAARPDSPPLPLPHGRRLFLL